MKRFIFSIAIMIAGVLSMLALDTPQYPGGEEALGEYISANLKYPELAKENGIEGVVNVCFVVNVDGTLSNIKIERMVDPDLEEEAKRLVKDMPAWIPAEKDGAKIAAPAKVTVDFSLQ